MRRGKGLVQLHRELRALRPAPTGRKFHFQLAAMALLVPACSCSAGRTPDSPDDAGTGPTVDAGRDAAPRADGGSDAGDLDAGDVADAGVDAATQDGGTDGGTALCDPGEIAGGDDYEADADTIALYHLDEAAAADIACDLSGNGNDGVAIGRDFLPASAGVFGTGWNFDGGYLELPADLFEGLAEFTVEGWFRADDADGGVIFAVGSPGEAGWLGIFFDDRGRRGFLTVGCDWRTPDGSDRATGGGANVGDGEFHHIALVYDGAEMIVYVDGGGKIGGPEEIAPGMAGPVRIATDGDDLVRMRVTVDEVRISSVARGLGELVTTP